MFYFCLFLILLLVGFLFLLKEIENLLKEELRKDRSKTQIEGFTKLDLMEMTRKHICSHKN